MREDDLTVLGKWKTTSVFWEMEDDLKFWENGRRPQFLGKWKTTSIFLKIEDNLNIFNQLIYFENGRRLIYYENGR